MSEKFSSLNEAIMNLVEKIRLADDLNKEDIDDLYFQLEKFCDLYEGEEVVPKETAYGLFVLHDNLEGALKHTSGSDLKLISNVNSKVNEYIERIFLS